MRSRGFTLTEMLTVISVIAILSGALLGGLSLLKKNQARTSTRALLEQVSAAIDAYVADHGVLGDTAADFQANPLTYLRQRDLDAGKVPYLELRQGQMSGTKILDAFKGPLNIVVTEGATGRRHTTKIVITSYGGTGNATTNSQDDAEIEWNADGDEAGQWKKTK